MIQKIPLSLYWSDTKWNEDTYTVRPIIQTNIWILRNLRRLTGHLKFHDFIYVSWPPGGGIGLQGCGSPQLRSQLGVSVKLDVDCCRGLSEVEIPQWRLRWGGASLWFHWGNKTLGRFHEVRIIMTQVWALESACGLCQCVTASTSSECGCDLFHSHILKVAKQYFRHCSGQKSKSSICIHNFWQYRSGVEIFLTHTSLWLPQAVAQTLSTYLDQNQS